MNPKLIIPEMTETKDNEVRFEFVTEIIYASIYAFVIETEPRLILERLDVSRSFLCIDWWDSDKYITFFSHPNSVFNLNTIEVLTVQEEETQKRISQCRFNVLKEVLNCLPTNIKKHYILYDHIIYQVIVDPILDRDINVFQSRLKNFIQSLPPKKRTHLSISASKNGVEWVLNNRDSESFNLKMKVGPFVSVEHSNTNMRTTIMEIRAAHLNHEAIVRFVSEFTKQHHSPITPLETATHNKLFEPKLIRSILKFLRY